MSYYSLTNTTLYASWVTEDELDALPDGTSFDKAYMVDRGSRTVTIDEAGECIYYRFVPIATGYYKFWSVGDCDTYGYLYDSSQTLLDRNDDRDEDNENFYISYNLEAGETYYIVVTMSPWGAATETGSFTFSIL